MTPLHSTTLDEINFKLILIAHYRKVYAKSKDHPATMLMMLEQTLRTYLEIKHMLVGAPKPLLREANRLVRQYDAKPWLDYVLLRPDASPAIGPENEP